MLKEKIATQSLSEKLVAIGFLKLKYQTVDTNPVKKIQIIITFGILTAKISWR